MNSFSKEQAKAEPNPDTYKPHVSYPQALNHPKSKTNELEDHLLEAFKKVTITIPLIDVIKHIPSYAKFHKCAHPIETLKGSNLVKQ